MFCTKCGAPLEGSKFCTMCGTPAPATETAPAPVEDICKNCGAPLEGRSFCVMCGTRAGEIPESVPEIGPIAEAEPTAVPEPEPITEPEAIEEAELEAEIEEVLASVEEVLDGDACANCGAPLEGRSFCVMCGTRAGEAPAPAVEPEPVVMPEPEPEPIAEEVPAEVPVSGDVCANCGAPLEGRSFCVMCGTRAGEVPAPAPVPAPAVEDNCLSCGASLNGKPFCVVCGTPKNGVKPAPAPADNCVNCGAPLNGKAFCIVCGTAKNGVNPVQKPVQTTYVPPVQPAYTPAAVVSPLKKAFGSTKFLVTAIFVTVYLLINIFASAGGLGIANIPAQLSAALTSGAVSANILPILIAVGLWITYASAKGNGKMSSAGLSIISVIMLLCLIGEWIVVAVAALAGLVFFVPGLIMLVSGDYAVFGGFITTDYGSGGAAGALVIGIGILAGAAVLLLFVLLFYRRLYKFSKSAVQSVKNDKAEYVFAGKVKAWLTFIGVLGIIYAVIVVIVGLAAPAKGVMLIGLGSLFSAVATLIGSSWIKDNCIEK
ncbi:MAG: hypothetical protein IJ017_05560 [Oscillospiraceae bacterium]|nr:hypothetical protein [Oscillospiraceae bacterium]